MTNPPLDPFAMWRQMLTKMESETNTFAGDTMKTDQFAQMLGQFTMMSSESQNLFEKALDGYFKTLRLPSRKDILAIEERLQRIEDKIDMLLSSGAAPAQTEMRPLRTRKPPAEPGKPTEARGG